MTTIVIKTQAELDALPFAAATCIKLTDARLEPRLIKKARSSRYDVAWTVRCNTNGKEIKP